MPVVLGRTVDRGVVAGDRAALWTGAGLLVLLGALTALADALRHRWETAAQVRVQVDLREQVAAAALRADVAGRDRWPPAELVARATGDADAVAGAAEASAWVVAQAIVIPVVVGLLLATDVLLGLTVVATVGVAVLATWRASAAWEARTEDAQQALAGYVSEVHGVLDGMKAIRGMGGEEGALLGVTRHSAAVRDRTTHTARLWVVFGPVVEVLSGVAAVAVLWVGGERAISGALGLGDVVAAAGLAVVLSEPVGSVGYGVVALRQAVVSSRRLAAIEGLGPPGPASDPPSTPEACPGDPLSLVIERVTAAFPSRPDRLVLRDVDLRIEPGQLVVVEGPVGAGKSALLAVLDGGLAPLTGQVELGGRPLGEWRTDDRQRAVLRLGPEPFLLADSVAANLRLGAPTATDAALREALEVADATDVVDGLADGLDTLLTDRGASLSGGQRQRLALARAVLADPVVILLDGALSGLEPARELSVLESVRDHWSEGIVVVVSAHPRARELARRSIVLGAATGVGER